MQPRSLMKKSAFMTRRKVIIYIVLTILTLGIVAGFTNPFVSDGTIHSSAFGETIVMEKAPPAVGRPTDYDLISNLQFAAYRLHHASFFRGETDGKVEADIGFTSYVQRLRNTRISTGDGIVFAETVSSSSLKSLAEQKYADNGIIIYRPSVSVKNGVPVFSDSAYQMTYDDFAKSYGSIPNQLSKYIITPETILSVKDEYADEQTQTSAEAPRDGEESDGGEFSFYVPENLVQGENGDYKFTLTLDPDASSRYYRNEVRTLGGADQNPKFYSVYVTINIDGEWNPISVTTRENYDIAIPVLGAMNCQGTNVETFYQINDENGEVPNRDFFRPYVDAAKNDPNYAPPAPPVVKPSSPADYLASAFADYISGKRNLELTANIKTDYVSAYDAVVSVNLGTTDVQAMLGDLYVKYAGDKVNIKLNGINGYLDTADLTDALKNPDVAALMGDKADLLKTLDFTAMLGGDILGTVFENCEMTSDNGVTRIQMTFDVDLAQIDKALGKAAVDASIYVNDDDMSLQSITGEVTVKGITLKINARPLASSPDFPSVDGAVDLKPLIDFIPDIAATATRKTFGIKGDISVNDIALGVDAYVDITDGTAAEATVTVNGLPVVIRYLGDEFYASIGDITVKGKADQIPELVEALKPIVGNSLDINGTLEKLKAMLPSTLNSYLSMIKNISATDTTLAAELNVLTVPVSLSLTRADGALSGAEFAAKIDLLGIKLDAALDLDLTYPTRRTISAPAGEYITVSELAALVSSVAPYLQADADYSVGFNGTVTVKGSPLTIGGKAEIDKLADESGNVTGVNAKGNVSALGIGADFAYVDGTAYVSVGALKLRADGDDLAALSPALSRILGMFGISLNGVSLDPAAMLGMIKGVSAKDGALIVELNALGTTVTASVNPQSGLITLVGDGIDLTLNVSIEKDINISAPADGEAYIALGALAPTLEAIADVLETKGVTANLALTLDTDTKNEKVYNASIKATFTDNTLKLNISEHTLPLDVTVIGNRVYIAVNNIRVTGTTDDIPALISALDGIIPSDIASAISGILAFATDINIEDTVGVALGTVKSFTEKDGKIVAQIAISGVTATVTVAADLTDIRADLAINGKNIGIAVTEFTPESVSVPIPDGEFVNAAELAALIPYVLEYVNAPAVDMSFGLTIGATEQNAFSINGNATLVTKPAFGVVADANILGQTARITYANGAVYATLGGISVKLAAAEIQGLLPRITAITTALGKPLDLTLPNLDFTDVPKAAMQILSLIDGLTLDDGVLRIAAHIDGMTVALEATAATGELAATVVLSGTTVKLTATASAAAAALELTVPTDAIDAKELYPAIDALPDIIKARGITANVALALNAGTQNEKIYNAALEASFADDNLKLTLNIPELPLYVTVIGKRAYIAVNDIRVTGTTDDIPALISALDGVIPQSASDIVTKLLGMLDNGMGDTSSVIEAALNAVKSISISNGMLDASIAAGGTELLLKIAADLSSATVIPVVDGTDITVSVTDITPAALDITPPAGEFAEADMIVAAAKPIMPLALAKAFALNVDVNLFGTRISGDVYMTFGKTLADVSVKAELVAGDLPVKLYVADGMIYLSIANTVSVKEKLSLAALDDLLTVIDGIKPGVKQTVTHIIEVIKATTLKDILGITRLAPATDGFVAELDLGRMTEAGDKVSLAAHTDGKKLTAIDVSCVLFGKAFGMNFDAVMTDGVLSALDSIDAEESKTSVNIGIAATEVVPVTVSSEYMALGDLTAFVSPALALADKIKTAGYAELDLGMFIGIDNNKQTYAEGKAKLWFAPFAAEVTLTMFKTENPETKANETNITVKYVNGTVYVECEQMLLKLDTATDIETLYGVISHYIPESNYLNKEIKKLLGLDDGASIFSSLSQLVERFEQIAACNGDAEKIVGLLFSPMSGLSNDSALKTVADMLGLMYNADGNVAVAANVMGMTLNVVPALANGTIERATVSTNVGLGKSSVYVRIGVDKYTLLSESDMPEAMTAPANETDFVSVMAFVSAIDNAVNTFTARDEDGNITVELNTFDFDYYIYRVLTAENEKGEIVNVKDSAGRDTPMTDAAGNKLIDKHIVVSNRDANTSVLQAKFIRREIKDESGKVVSVKYDFNLAAHIKLDIRTSSDGSKEKLASKTGYPITLDLYMINDGVSAATAFVDYKESSATGGNGERVYIDYNSLMQIVAAALDIIDVNDKTMTELLGDYRLDVDTTVFDSMSIAGLNDIKVQIDNVAKAVEHGKAAIGHVKNAWNAVICAGSVDGLKAKLEDIGAMMENAKASLDLAVAALGIKKSDAPEKKEMTEINGKLFKNIVTGVAFGHKDDALSANIQNSLTTGTSGTATVSATSINDRITAVEVDGLDVNTKLLQTFKASFTSGNKLDIALPADYQSDSMNFGNVKHLLFDIMNTANMLEFEIGGGSNDKINLDVLGVIKMDIKYSAKVKIVDQGVGANPRYKTAADIQLDIPGYHTNAGRLTVFGVPKCTTRVFFYDDVIYMHGVDSWDGVVSFSNWSYHYSYNVNYKDEMFTVDEFFDMLDTEKHTDGIDRLFKEFVFKLLPLRESFIVNIHDEIIKAIKNPPAASANLHTLAQIFKGYEYNNGLHNLTLGLKELALNGSLRDLKVNFTGANDGDDNILDNYVSTAYIETAFGTDGTTIATLKLDASLVNAKVYTQYYTDATFTVPSPDNAQTDYARTELKSKGLNKTNIDGKQYALDGTDGIINTLLAVVTKDAKGNITDVQNRAGGINWSRPWKAAK